MDVSLRRDDVLRYKYSRIVIRNPKNHIAWISYSQIVKRPFNNEVVRLDKVTSREGMLRSRKVLYIAEKCFDDQSETRQKAQIIQARGLLEFQFGNKIFGIALLERAVMFSSICKPVLSWLIVKKFIQSISSCELATLQLARKLLKS